MAQNPTVRRLQLGRELRRLRERAEVSREDAAQELECHVSKVSRIEAGKMSAGVTEVKALLRLYSAAEDESEQVLTIAREARKRSTYRVPDWVRAYVGMEAEATEIKDFQVDLIPGLLQTRAYTEAVTRAADPTRDPAEVDRLVAIRSDRQGRLTGDDPPLLWVVIDEAAIRRTVGGPEVMRDQLLQLREIARLPSVSVRILPFGAGAHAAMGTPFTIVRLPDPPGGQVACVQSLWSVEYLDRPAQVDAYSVVFDRLCASALDDAESAGIIDDIAGGLR
jgi:transcriptional regulator with XRE-family HTH domain